MEEIVCAFFHNQNNLCHSYQNQMPVAIWDRSCLCSIPDHMPTALNADELINTMRNNFTRETDLNRPVLLINELDGV